MSASYYMSHLNDREEVRSLVQIEKRVPYPQLECLIDYKHIHT